MSPSENRTEPFTEDVVLLQDKQDDFILLRGVNRMAAERRIVRRLDTRLLLVVLLICLINYIDRVAITAARLQGLEQDLGPNDIEYDTVLAVLYAFYGPAQIPSNMILSCVSRPSFYIATCVLSWGLTGALTGVTKNFSGTVACRIFTGLAEAAFYPGSMFLLSSWYTQKELPLRSSILYAGLLMSGAFGSVMAAGILGNMDRKLGITAWRWLFLIEGAINIFIGLLSVWLLPDLPHNTRWMTPAERRLAQARLAEDVGEADQNVSGAIIFDGLKLAICDVKVWTFMFMTYCIGLGGSFSIFFLTLTATLGYSTTKTLLMAAAPSAFVPLCSIINSWSCDRNGQRCFHIIAWFCLTILGCMISLSTMSTRARYFSFFLMTSGLCGSGLISSWVSNVVPRPPAKRSVAIGLVNGASSLGGLTGSYVWKARWGPGYRQSMIVVICSLTLGGALGLVIRRMLIRENERMEREQQIFTDEQRERIEEAGRLEGISFEEAVHRREGFRYLY